MKLGICDKPNYSNLYPQTRMHRNEYQSWKKRNDSNIFSNLNTANSKVSQNSIYRCPSYQSPFRNTNVKPQVLNAKRKPHNRPINFCKTCYCQDKLESDYPIQENLDMVYNEYFTTAYKNPSNSQISDEDYNDIIKFRNKYFYECHSAESKLRNFTNTEPQHKCRHEFTLNKSNIPEPVYKDHNSNSRCLDCHLPMDLIDRSSDDEDCDSDDSVCFRDTLNIPLKKVGNKEVKRKLLKSPEVYIKLPVTDCVVLEQTCSGGNKPKFLNCANAKCECKVNLKNKAPWY